MARLAARNLGLGENRYHVAPTSPRMTTRNTQLTWLSPDESHTAAGHLITSMIAQS